MTLTMTLIYATLAFVGGAGLAYVWQRMRIRQLEDAATTRRAQLAEQVQTFEEAWTARYEAGITDALAKVRERHVERGYRAAETRRRKAEVSDAVA